LVNWDIFGRSRVAMNGNYWLGSCGLRPTPKGGYLGYPGKYYVVGIGIPPG